MKASTVRVLSFHAAYRCRHSGRCCSSGWPIAVDAIERRRVEEAISTGALTSAVKVFAHTEATSGGAVLASTSGRCVFHVDSADGGCRIHRTLGHEALPLACRQFPRQSVRDPRGVSVTLSHYCPTAHGLLLTSTGSTAIVENPAAFPADAEYVGLTADPELPPLLHPTLAMDWESWWLFEDLAVSLLTDAPEPLRRLRLAVEHVRGWSVGRGPLLAHVQDAFDRARANPVKGDGGLRSRVTDRIADVLASVPDEWRAEASGAVNMNADRGSSGAIVDDSVRRRYLAAHAFANWAAYQGEGLRAWFRSVEAAGALLRHTGDPGAADLVLRHLADSTALIRQWNRAECGSHDSFGK